MTMSTKSANIPATSPALTLPDDSSSKYPELVALDTRWKGLRDTILPEAPYILTVKSERPYVLNSTQTKEWTRGTHFEPHEQELQYVSYLRDWSDSLIMPRSGWDDGKGGMLNIATQQSPSRSGTNTPKQGQTSGKKLTLSEYKARREAGQLGVKTLPPPVPEVTITEKANAVSSAPAVEKSNPTNGPTADSAVQEGQSNKRSAEAMLEPQSQTKSTTSKDEPSPYKKPRISTSPSCRSPMRDGPTAQKKPKLPDLFMPKFPTLLDAQPKSEHNLKLSSGSGAGLNLKKDINTDSVPRDLKNSERSRDARDRDGKKVNHNADRTSQYSTVPDGKASKSTQASDSTSSRKQETHVQSSSRNTKNVSRSNGTTDIKPAQTSVEKTAKKESSANGKTSTTAKVEPSRPSLIVKLRIPKARRKDVARLLQMTPLSAKMESIKAPPKVSNRSLAAHPEKCANQASQSERDRAKQQSDKQKGFDSRREEGNGASHARTTSNGATNSATKRPRVEDDTGFITPNNKRQKPGSQDFRSPLSTQNGSGQKFKNFTNDTKGPASRHLAPGEFEATTPHGSDRTGTPVAPSTVEKGPKETRSASNTSSITGSSASTHDERLNTWFAEKMQYYHVARRLKHEADNLFNSLDGRELPQIEKRAMAKGIESILAFMLFYALEDDIEKFSKRSALGRWSTIFGLMGRVQQITAGNTLVHGLCVQLEAVCRELTAIAYDEQLLSRPLPKYDSSADGPTTALQQAEYDDYFKLKAGALENARQARKAWILGNFELSIDDLQHTFPKSWQLKARAPLARMREHLDRKSLDGDFYLPLSSVSTGIEAVRAGWSLLKEWCRVEDVELKGLLPLAGLQPGLLPPLPLKSAPSKSDI